MSLPAQKPETKEVPEWLQNAIRAYDADNRPDGDILTHEWIKWALQVPVPESMEDVDNVQWMLLQRVDAFRDWLLIERKTALQSVRGKGYWIVPPNEQARVAAEEWAKMIKRGSDKAAKLLEHARLADMDTESAQRHTDTQIRMAGVSQMLTKQRRDVFKMLGGAQ
jgi:hypothetical protein